jgi:two-component system, OmpR family, sensor histidine kinase TctE
MSAAIEPSVLATPAPVESPRGEAASATLTAPSLKRALTRRLTIGLVLIGVVGTVVAYAVATHFATRAYDRSLFDDVKVLASQARWTDGGMEIMLSPDALPWLLTDESEDVTYRVTDLASGRVLTGNGDLGPLPGGTIVDEEPNFRSVEIAPEKLRVAFVRHRVGPQGAVLVEVGETLRKREAVASGILVGTLTLMSMIGLVAVVLVRSGVSKALAPLQALEADVARRSIGDLQTLDPSSAPAEVRGLIEAINHMIGRVSQSIDLQRHFLANAAHQLKTPIAGLRLQAQLALKADPTSPARDSMREVERRAGHSAHLIEQLLTLARAEASADVLPAMPCSLADVAAGVIERRLSDAIGRRIDLGFESDGAPGTIVANPVLAGELVANLVDNALHHGREGGQVTVTLASADGLVSLAVSDDGAGLSADQREQVFRRFWRSDASTGDGAGLGLAIVKEIAERYRGTVAISSRPEFDGTRVEVRFATAEHGG